MPRLKWNQRGRKETLEHYKARLAAEINRTIKEITDLYGLQWQDLGDIFRKLELVLGKRHVTSSGVKTDDMSIISEYSLKKVISEIPSSKLERKAVVKDFMRKYHYTPTREEIKKHGLMIGNTKKRLKDYMDAIRYRTSPDGQLFQNITNGVKRVPTWAEIASRLDELGA